MIGRSIACLVIGIIFGLMGLPLGLGFFNYGSILFGLFSIACLVIALMFKR